MMGRWRILLLLALVRRAPAQYLQVEKCDASQGEYFDNAALSCFPCENTQAVSKNKVPDLSDLDPEFGNAQSCTCKAGFYKVPTDCGLGQPEASKVVCAKFSCAACPANHAVSEDQSTCLPCAKPSGSSSSTATATNVTTATNGTNATNPTSSPASSGMADPADGSVFDAATSQCTCTSGSSRIVERNPFTGELYGYKACVACPSGAKQGTLVNNALVADATAYTCAACPHPNMTFDSSTGVCACTPSETFSNAGVAGFGELECIYQSEIVAGSTATSATEVHYWTMQDTADYYHWPPQTQTYTKLGSPVNSILFKHWLTQAGARCTFYGGGEDARYCQVLANLCTLTLYDTTSTACKMLEEVQRSARPTLDGFSNWKQTVPYIVISQTETTTLTQQLGMTMSFDAARWQGTFDSLNFTVAAYALNGTFLGLEQLTDQFSWCKQKSRATIAGGVLPNEGGAGAGSEQQSSSSSSSSSTNAFADTTPTYGKPPSGSTTWLKHGTSYSEKYWCDLEALPEMEEPKLYDIYIVDKSESRENSLRLYPVPVRVLNYGGKTDNMVNINSMYSERSDDQYHRRVFMYDQVTGVSAVGAKPEVIRYADYIEFETQIVSTDSEKIQVPVLTIHYAERTMGAAGLAGPMKTAQLEFKALYTQDMTSYWGNANGLFVASVILACFLFGGRVFLYCRRNTRPMAEMPLDGQFFARVFMFIFSSWTKVMFWYIFVMCLYWFLFYKVSTAVFCMLPADRLNWLTNNDYYPFRVIVGLCFVGQVFRMVEIIMLQCNIDIFMMDWEKPRGKLVNPREASGDTKTTPISAWRTIFCANEWNEMQCIRKTDSTLTLIFILFLFVGCDMQYVATPQPDIYDLSPGEVNPVIRFAHTALWFLIIEMIQLAWNFILWERYVEEPKPQLFQDVCTIAKISLFILDEKYHGYYIHCDSPAPFADANMLEMAHDFTAQEGGMMLPQPIPDDGTNPSTKLPMHEAFEVYVTKAWRDKYDSIFTSVSKKQLRNRQRQGQGGNGADAEAQTMRQSGVARAVGAGGAPPDQLVKASRKLNRFLKRFISKTDRDHLREMRPNNAQHRVCRFPPELSDSNKSVVYGDSQFLFQNLLIIGVEFDMMLLNILTWSVMDLWLDDTAHNNPVAAALVTWIVEKLFLYIRATLGSINIHKKTLVDARFLL